MAFCTNCGTEIGDSSFCSNCGASQGDAVGKSAAAPNAAGSSAPVFSPPQYTPPNTPETTTYAQPPKFEPAPNPDDTGSLGWAVLGFFFPLIGLILYLVWKSTKPASAKRAGIGALVGVVASVVLNVLIGLIGVAAYAVG